MKKLILLALILFPLVTSAQRMASPKDYVLLEPLPCIQNTGQGNTEAECADGTLIKKISTDTYIAYIFNFAIAFAGVAAVIVIMVAGFQYAVSDIISNKSAARERIKNAVVGLVTVICSFFILELVDPRLVNIDTRLEEIDIRGQVFDYNSLVNTAMDYNIKNDLRIALTEAAPYNAEAQLLKEEAAKLRLEAAGSTDPAKIEALNNLATAREEQARENEKISLGITSRASLKATADMQYQIINNIDGTVKSVTSQLDLIKQRKTSIAGQADKDIKRLTDLGDPIGAQLLREAKDYYLAKFDQDIIIKTHTATVDENMNNFIAKYGSWFTGLGGGAASTAAKAMALSEAKVSIKAIEDRPIPANLTVEYYEKMKQDKKAAIEKITKLITPTP